MMMMMMVIHFDALARTDHALITTGRALLELFWQLKTLIVHMMAQIYICLTTTPATVAAASAAVAVVQCQLEHFAGVASVGAATPTSAAIDSRSESCNYRRIGAHNNARILVLRLTVAAVTIVVVVVIVARFKVAKPSTHIVEVKVNGVPRIARHTHTRLDHRRWRHGHRTRAHRRG